MTPPLHREEGRNPAGSFRVGALLAFALLAVPGCAAFFDAPDVRIADVRVSGIGLSGATADVVLDVTNPNRFDLTARGLRYRLELEDRVTGVGSDAPEGAGTTWHTVAEGESDRRLTVPSGDRASVSVEVPFEYADLGRAALAVLRDGSLRYRLSGDVLFDMPLGDVRVPFDDTGTVGL